MNINQAKAPQSNRPVYIPEEGMQLGVIFQVIDLGIQKRRPFKGVAKDPARTIRVTYELVNDVRDFEGEEKPLIVSEEFVFSGDDRSTCYKRLNAIDPGFKKSGGDWSAMAGHPVQIQIIHRDVKQEDGSTKTYANIGGVSPLMKGMPAPESTFNEVLVFNTDTPDSEVFDKLPDFLKEKIMGGEKPPTFSGAKQEQQDDFSNDAVDSTEEEGEDDWA